MCPDGPDSRTSRARREWLAGSLALATCVAAPRGWSAGVAPEKQPAQVGDQLVWPSWEDEDRLLQPDDLGLHDEPLLVYPRDPASGIARERSRLNQILVIRFEQGELDEDTAAVAAGGVVAFSGICTHTACGITGWKADELQLVCPCHTSTFDPRRHGKRVSGPAPRSLPMLPITFDGGAYVVSAAFTSPVGAQT